MNDDEELEQFKRSINIAELAASYGFKVEGRPYPSGYTMRNAGSKIVVATDAKDGHGIFFEVHGNTDGGSVVDFVMWQRGCNLGYARKYLREYCGQSSFSFPTAPRLPKPLPVERDRAKVLVEWEEMQPYKSGYLKGRKLTPETIAQFTDHIRIDNSSYGNVCFLHEDENGVTGYEMKNMGFMGFAKGGEKALFLCQVGEARDTIEQRIIIAESAIDAMSCYQLNPSDGIFISIAGGLNPKQPELLRRTLAKYPHARIFIATDNDLPTKDHPKPEGEHYYEVIRALCPSTATAIRAIPPEPYKDWNDYLMKRPRQPKKDEHGHTVRIVGARSAARDKERIH